MSIFIFIVWLGEFERSWLSQSSRLSFLSLFRHLLIFYIIFFVILNSNFFIWSIAYFVSVESYPFTLSLFILSNLPFRLDDFPFFTFKSHFVHFLLQLLEVQASWVLNQILVLVIKNNFLFKFLKWLNFVEVLSWS